MNLGPWELIIIAVLILALFGYKKLPDATRAVGRSLRIFKGEMKGMKDDDVAAKAEAQTVRAPMPPVVESTVTHPIPQPGATAQPPATPVTPPAPAAPAAPESAAGHPAPAPAPAPQPQAQPAPAQAPAPPPADPTAPPRA